jgi:hypothetical protein
LYTSTPNIGQPDTGAVSNVQYGNQGDARGIREELVLYKSATIVLPGPLT